MNESIKTFEGFLKTYRLKKHRDGNYYITDDKGKFVKDTTGQFKTVFVPLSYFQIWFLMEYRPFLKTCSRTIKHPLARKVKGGNKLIYNFNSANKIAQKHINQSIASDPKLLAEYSDKNTLPADQVIKGTAKKLWWKCSKCSHEWKTSGSHRVNGTGCPNYLIHDFSNTIASDPKLLAEYSDKNALPADQVMKGTNKKFWWKCSKCSHEWEARGNSRAIGIGCPKFKFHDTANTISSDPQLLAEYSDKNALPADQVMKGTNKKFWWKCSKCSHEWEARGSGRVKGRGCPACANKVVTQKNSIASDPQLLAEYSDRNPLPAHQVAKGTRMKLRWKCSVCSHEWIVKGNSRANGSGCPEYRKHPNSVAYKNSIASDPKLLAEYSDKNTLPAHQVVKGTIKKLWWKCSKCSYEWEASGNSRVNGNGCPNYRQHLGYINPRKK